MGLGRGQLFNKSLDNSEFNAERFEKIADSLDYLTAKTYHLFLKFLLLQKETRAVIIDLNKNT